MASVWIPTTETYKNLPFKEHWWNAELIKLRCIARRTFNKAKVIITGRNGIKPSSFNKRLDRSNFLSKINTLYHITILYFLT